jgi:hypothetical protein
MIVSPFSSWVNFTPCGSDGISEPIGDMDFIGKTERGEPHDYRYAFF